MKLEKCKRLYLCCGEYIAPTDSVKNKQIKCPRCGKNLNNIVSEPIVIIAKNN